MSSSTKTINYANPLYGEEEIAAVVEALRTTNQLQIGPRVREMESRVAAMFEKRYGVMTNSGTSALFLAVELLDLPKGSEILTSIMSFSATFAPIVRGGYVASYVDDHQWSSSKIAACLLIFHLAAIVMAALSVTDLPLASTT